MKTEKITVNKTAEQPAGVEIELVMPEGAMEEKLLGFLLTLYLRDLKKDGRVSYDLPDRFAMDYRGEGRYLASVSGGTGTYYEPPRALCMVGLRAAEGRFDLIHAGSGVAASAPAAPPATPQTIPETPPATPQEPPASAPEAGSEGQSQG